MFVGRPVCRKWLARLILIAFSLLVLAGTLLYVGESSLARVSSSPVQRATTAKAAASGVQSRVLAEYGDLPIAFERNNGQIDGQVKFLSRGHGYTLFLTGSEAVLSLPAAPTESKQELTDRSQDETAKHRVLNAQSRPSSRAMLRMQLVGSRTQSQVVGENPLPAVSNYYIGNDPRKWQTGIPQYARVSYGDVYPGIDLAFHGAQKQLEFDFVVSPGAKPQEIALHFSGARHLHTDDAGGLVLTSAAGDLHLHKPFAYQEKNGVRQPIDARFVLKENNQVAFAVGPYDARQRLVIDPTVTYATYLGGTGEDKATAVAVDSNGNAYITGEAGNSSFPTTTGPAFGGGPHDAFVVKLNSTGTSPLVYSTFIGGSGDDSGNAITVDASGNAYVAGGTQSTNFPGTSGHFQPSLNGAFEKAFVAKLDPSGALSYATYLGGTITVALAAATNVASGIAIDGSGNAYVAGQTNATDFPPKNAFQASLAGGLDAFVTELNPTASTVLYSTYLGGAGDDDATAIAFNTKRSRVDVTGVTLSSGASPFPTSTSPAAFQTTAGGLDDAFVAELDTTKSGTASLLYSTYFGGSGKDDANGIAVDPTGAVYITGLTQSSSATFPLKNAFQSTLKSAQNAFVAKLDPTQPGAASLIYSTYLGGTGSDDGLSIAVDGAGNAYVTGETSSPDLPLQGATQTTYGGGTDAFVTELDAAGSALAFSTFLGGSLAEDSGAGGNSAGIAVDNANNIYVVGYTASTNFPVTTGAFQTSFQGGTADAFAAKFTAATAPTFTLTASAPSPNPVAKGSSATSTITLNAMNGFSGTVNLTCAPPAGITCSPNPTSVTASSPTSTLTINVSATASLTSPSIRPDSQPLYVLWLPIPGLALMGVGLGSLRMRKKKLLGLLLGLSVFAGLVFLIACSSSKGGGGGGPTPYSVTVTGTAGSISNNVTVSGTFQ